MSKTIYTSTEAREYLGLARQTFLYHIEQGHIAPDMELSSGHAYTIETLERFKDQHQTVGLTIEEAAAYLGVSENWVINRLYYTHELVPDGKRGRRVIFKPATLDALRPLVGQRQKRKPKKT